MGEAERLNYRLSTPDNDVHGSVHKIWGRETLCQELVDHLLPAVSMIDEHPSQPL